MIKELVEKLQSKIDTRKTLISLKDELKNLEKQQEFLKEILYDYSLLRELLENEDPKVRKNVAIIIGILKLDGMGIDLVEAYEQEDILFVKSEYLKALKNIDCENYLEPLKDRMKVLMELEISEEDKKHINEEIRALNTIVLKYENDNHHRFIGYNEENKLVLVTNRSHQVVTLSQIQGNEISKKIPSGVALVSRELRDVLSIRTYDEMLFILAAKNIDFDAKKIAENILEKANIVEFLKIRHSGDAPFRFRLEIRTRLDVDAKNKLIKKASMEIEHLSKHQLVNSTSDYEIEIRLIENKDGKLNAYLKLYTIKDNRFNYRKNVLPTSINPITAATIMELAKPYLKERAQVLDPFCGTGTMLIERNHCVEAYPMYGIDSFGDAIKMARENTDLARMKVNYINRDFADFKHEYLFDEIITNMPSVVGKKREDEIYSIYQLLFRKAKHLLKEDGVIILYSTEPNAVKKCMQLFKEYKIVEQYEIYKKLGSYLFILKAN